MELRPGSKATKVMLLCNAVGYELEENFFILPQT